MRKEITICGCTLTAEGTDKRDLQADEDSAKWYAEKTGFDLRKLMEKAGWVTVHRHLIEEINTAVGGVVFPALVPSKDYAEKEKAAMDSGIGGKKLKTAAERMKEIFSIEVEKLKELEKAFKDGASEEDIREVCKKIGLDASSLPRGFFTLDPKSFERAIAAASDSDHASEDEEEEIEDEDEEEIEDEDDDYDEDYDEEESW